MTKAISEEEMARVCYAVKMICNEAEERGLEAVIVAQSITLALASRNLGLAKKVLGAAAMAVRTAPLKVTVTPKVTLPPAAVQ